MQSMERRPPHGKDSVGEREKRKFFNQGFELALSPIFQENPICGEVINESMNVGCVMYVSGRI